MRRAAGWLVGGMRLSLFIVWTAICIPLQSAVYFFTKGPALYALPLLWHKSVCALFGIRVKCYGTPCSGKNVVFLSNHLSYLDIPVMASKLPASFVAKDDVRRWPLFGLLAVLQNTFFISRNPARAAEMRAQLQQRLSEGRGLIAFPEGTSTSGNDVAPFKSAFFAPFLDLATPPTLQMMAVIIRDPEKREIYAWHDDTPLIVHLLRFSTQFRTDIELHFHPRTWVPDANEDRKQLSLRCHALVNELFLNSPLPLHTHVG